LKTKFSIEKTIENSIENSIEKLKLNLDMSKPLKASAWG